EFLKYLQSNPVDYLPLIDHIDPKDWGAFTHLIFPNLIILGTEFSWATIEIIPVSPTMTRVKSRTLTMPLNPITRAIGSGYEKASALLRQVMGYRPEEKPLESGDFFLEDVYACEQQQKAMNSPQFAFGPTSIDKEQLIIDFHRTMMDFMQDKS
ncbi:MAG: RHO alpha subunit C-terminal catalytic domain-containing protein, partial [Chloroflexota bacterium]